MVDFRSRWLHVVLALVFFSPVKISLYLRARQSGELLKGIHQRRVGRHIHPVRSAFSSWALRATADSVLIRLWGCKVHGIEDGKRIVLQFGWSRKCREIGWRRHGLARAAGSAARTASSIR